MSKISKLGLGIVAFEGTEHIKNIIYEVRDSVDEIIICLQKLSYHNTPIEQYDVEEVDRLVKCGFVDKVIWYENDSSKYSNISDKASVPRRMECDKRNYILDELENDGCSHSMIIDSDEYYDGFDFKRAKEYIDKNSDVKITYCQYLNYWRDYRHYLVWPFKSYVPFITESKYRFEFGGKYVSFPIDPTRIYKIEEGEQYNIFNWDSLKMHHLSWIRIDIKNKINSWSSKKYFNSKLLDIIYNRYVNWKEGECAIIMFSVPRNRINVVTFRNQYIHPKYRIDYKLDENRDKYNGGK